MKQLGVSMMVAAVLLASASANAQSSSAEAVPGARLLAAGCVACHGSQGRAQAGAVGLAGLNEAHFITQMQAFKSGQRSATVMHQIAKGYGDAEIAMLAKYFSAQAR